MGTVIIINSNSPGIAKSIVWLIFSLGNPLFLEVPFEQIQVTKHSEDDQWVNGTTLRAFNIDHILQVAAKQIEQVYSNLQEDRTLSYQDFTYN